MKVVNDKLPTEGVIIGGTKFCPGKEQEVSAELGKALVERKGFKEVGGKPKTKKEDDKS